jgi:putative ABC transport system permease protein
MKHFVKITLRNLLRQKLYSFINIFGLALGVAACLLILLYVQDELSYDSFHAGADRIYRVTMGMNGDGQPTNANGSVAAAPALLKNFPGIEHAVRFRKMGWDEERVVACGNRRFYEDGFMFADSTLFDVFSFSLLRGDPKQALAAPGSMLITQSMARKYFGSEDPIGKVITVDAYNNGKFMDFAVTGVLRDIPENSHIRFNFLASFSSQTDTLSRWSLEGVFTYVILKRNADPKALEALFPQFLKNEIGRPTRRSIHLQPLKDIRLHSHLDGELEPNGDIAYVYIFSSVALFILLIACINFMNLATARSARRAREVGMRKVLGAYRAQLMRQFIGEALVTSVLAMITAIVLAEAMLPLFNSVAEKSLDLNLLTNPIVVAGLLLLTLFVGLMAGSYPAFLLSSFKPAEALRGRFGHNDGWSKLVRKGLVAFQFAISITLLVCTLVAQKQLDFIRTKNLGFNRDQVIVLPLNDEIRRNYDALRSDLLSDSHVLNISLAEGVPGRAGNGAGYQLGDNPEIVDAFRLFVDYDFLKTYGITLAAGRDFDRSYGTDGAAAYIVNESFVSSHHLGSAQSAIGKKLTMLHGGMKKPGVIVGIARDFNIFSLHAPIEEAVMTIMPMEDLNFVSIHVSPVDIPATLHRIESVWGKESPRYPFEYYFVDQDFDRLHRADIRLGKVFEYFSALAILAACLGLFGLSSFTAEQRKKEIGIRKVLGASVSSVTGLLTAEFVRIVLVANIVAWPVAYFVMHKWLQEFAYRITPEIGSFLLAGVTAAGIAVLTVGFQTLNASLINPVEALRHE